MAISLGSNLALHTRLPLDDRTIMETIEEMKDYPENFLPDIAYCFVKADGKMYVFNRDNESTELTGKWRVLEGSGGGTADVPIEKIKVNGELQTPVNKVVDITVPDAYDDTDIVQRISNIESDYVKSSEIPSKVSELENDSNYQTAEQVNSTVITEIAKVVADAPEDFNTLKEMSDWIAGHENDASAMNSAISDNKTNIEILQTDVSNINTSLDTKFDKTQNIDKAGYVAVIGDDGNMTFTEPTTLGGNAEVVNYENDDYPELTNVALALNSLLDKVNYLEPELTSFTISPSIETYEIGSEITDLQFSWSYNKEIKSQTLTDCTIVADDRSAVYPSTLSATKTFTLTFSDGQTVKVGSKKISFLPKIYYGCCPEAEYNSEFVLALSDSVLASNPKRDYAFNCGVGEFAYIVCPTSQNFKGDIWVNGFQATMEKVSTISVTNASNYTQSYDVWRFSNDGLGSFVGTVK